MNNNEEHSVIYDLGAKKLSGDITGKELKSLDEILSKSDENKKIYSELEFIWQKSSPKIEVNVDSAWDKLSSRMENTEKETPVIHMKSTRPYQWMSIAATIILAIGIFTLYRFNQEVQNITYTASNTEQIELPDGSLINLKANSTLTYPEKFTASSREVNLKGEAFFDIQRDESKPFIIHTNSIDVQVLGTSFFVNTMDEKHIEVNVKTGKVQVTDIKNDSNNVVLVKDENVVFNKVERAFHSVKLEANKLYWQTKTLIFQRTTLQEVMHIVNMNYNKNVIIVNEEMKHCKLTVTFKNKSFEEVMEVIKATFNASTEQHDDQILLKGENCE